MSGNTTSRFAERPWQTSTLQSAAGGPEQANSTASGSLHMTTQHGDRSCTIRLRGELDSASAPTLCEQVAPWLQTCRRLVVDMREVSFLDSAGLRAILDLYRCLNERGVSLHLIEGEEGNVPRVLRHAGLESLIRHDEASLG